MANHPRGTNADDDLGPEDQTSLSPGSPSNASVGDVRAKREFRALPAARGSPSRRGPRPARLFQRARRVAHQPGQVHMQIELVLLPEQVM
ncbi:hypothetical protein L3X38_021787 [Prunus dulcis]|uniref:Uncharacterized protein n=1 Tax=Prunus dulcis TaxID=3755 RepID=A0AAD4VVP4_PRUDU|nr:hypothetical protein L3X38_021787 [Prunus dulcis]